MCVCVHWLITQSIFGDVFMMKKPLGDNQRASESLSAPNAFPLIELQQGNIEIDRIANPERKKGERGEIEFRTDKSINSKC